MSIYVSVFANIFVCNVTILFGSFGFEYTHGSYYFLSTIQLCNFVALFIQYKYYVLFILQDAIHVELNNMYLTSDPHGS